MTEGCTSPVDIKRLHSRKPRCFHSTRELVESRQWFANIFGFDELPYKLTQKQFEFAGGILVCKENSKVFKVGPFEPVSLRELKDRYTKSTLKAVGSFWSLAGLTFANITGDFSALHGEAANAGAVFQVASFFNCLETAEGATPEDGITRYGSDMSQGSQCAIACPAATIFRNYFYSSNGQVGGEQVDCLAGVAELVRNEDHSYWTMRNGYCVPRVKGGIARLSRMIASDPFLRDDVRSEVKVGVHWDTEVWGVDHSVCQVFCSALPVGCEKSIRMVDWRASAQVVLESVFDATLTAAAVLATQRGCRVKVYLTPVGGGWLGNRIEWIAGAIERALRLHEKHPLDIFLVHPESVPPTIEYERLAAGRGVSDMEAQTEAMPIDILDIRCVSDHLTTKGLPKPDPTRAALITAAFQRFDLNGDGVIDRNEFVKVLQTLDSEFFTLPAISMLLKEADADGDGVVHYFDFVSWLVVEDDEVADLVLDSR